MIQGSDSCLSSESETLVLRHPVSATFLILGLLLFTAGLVLNVRMLFFLKVPWPTFAFALLMLVGVGLMIAAVLTPTVIKRLNEMDRKSL